MRDNLSSKSQPLISHIRMHVSPGPIFTNFQMVIKYESDILPCKYLSGSGLLKI